VTGYKLRWFTHPKTGTHPSTNTAVHGWESNSQPVYHKFVALTTTQPSHLTTTTTTRRCAVYTGSALLSTSALISSEAETN